MSDKDVIERNRIIAKKSAEIESLRSRLADLEAERELIVQRAENAERALVEAESRRDSVFDSHDALLSGCGG